MDAELLFFLLLLVTHQAFTEMTALTLTFLPQRASPNSSACLQSYFSQIEKQKENKHSVCVCVCVCVTFGAQTPVWEISCGVFLP